MKRFISAVLQVLAIGLFSVLLSSTVFADQAKSENFAMPIAQTGKPVMKNDSTAKIPTKKEMNPEEKAIYLEKLTEAKTRDHDETVAFSDNSTISCYWGFVENKLNSWLMKNKDVVVDRKEYLLSAYSNGSKNYSGEKCATTIVAHYHKIIKKETKKEKRKK